MFIPTYAGALDAADEAWVCFSPSAGAQAPSALDVDKVQAAFQNPGLNVVTDPAELRNAFKRLQALTQCS